MVSSHEEALQAGVDAAVAAAGNSNRLAVRLGLSRQAIRKWSKVPAERVREVEQTTGVPLHILRPDLYDTPPDNQQAAE